MVKPGRDAICSTHPSGGSVFHTVAHNLQVLGLEYVDLLLLHWPCDDLDASVHAYEAMEQARNTGTARAIGVSNFNRAQIAQLESASGVRPAAIELEYHPWVSEETKQLCRGARNGASR